MAITEGPQGFEFGEFRVDAVQRLLLKNDGTRVTLHSRAFELLLFFLRHPGELLDKDQLMKAAWPHTIVEENNLNQSIGAIRRALGEAPSDRRFLATEPGRGYRFVAPVRSMRTEPEPAPAPAPAPARRRRAPVILMIVVLLAGIIGTVGTLSVRRGQTRIADRSIAVLPFENRSEAPENGYLALGIQDEVLTLLTRIGDLRVVPRASTAKFSGSAAATTEIGAELKVSYLLEGSVQRSGDRIRVNVTLIDVGRERQLWASSYERSASGIFAVESEVARDVATALRARLTAGERTAIAEPPTAVPAAYEAYLHAKAFAERTTRAEAEIHEAIAAYTEAVRLDPSFALAWAQLSRRHANLYSLNYDRSAERRHAAQRALERAAELSPASVETQAAHAYFRFVVAADLEGAEREFHALHERNAASADATAGLAQVLRELGRQQHSDEFATRTLVLDPLNPYRHAIICEDFLTARELESATQACARASELLPVDEGIITLQATMHQMRGELDRSRALLKSLTPGPGDWRTLRALSRQALLDREPAKAVQLLTAYLEDARSLGSRRGVVRHWLADAQRLSGDSAAARASYELARTELEAQLAAQPENALLSAQLAVVQARLARRSAALAQARSCTRSAARARREAFIVECAQALMHTELATGAPTEAIARVREALISRGALPPLTPALLSMDPDFDELRGRNDFQKLMLAPIEASN